MVIPTRVDRPALPGLPDIPVDALRVLDTETIRLLVERDTLIWSHVARLHTAPWWVGVYPPELEEYLDN